MSDYLSSLVERERGHADVIVPRLPSRYEPPPREAAADGGGSPADEVVEARASRDGSRQRRDGEVIAAGVPIALPSDHAAGPPRTVASADGSKRQFAEPPAPPIQSEVGESLPAHEKRGAERVRAAATIYADAPRAGDATRATRIASLKRGAATFGATEDVTVEAPTSLPDTARRAGTPRMETPTPSGPERRNAAIPASISIARHNADDAQATSSEEFGPPRRADASGRNATTVRGERARDTGSVVREPLATPDAPTIHVTIGRVEVRAVAAPVSTTRPHATHQPMSLDEYLLQRNKGSRQ